MSLPYVKCSNCGKRNSAPLEENYFQCVDCGYLEPKESAILEDNKDYEEERERIIEVKEEELKEWEREQEELCKKVVNYLLPSQKVDLSFKDWLSSDCWGTSSYRENNLVKANQARQRFTAMERLGYFGVNNLIIYSQEPSKIIISQQALRVKQTSAKYGLAGFLPTSAHEVAHISSEVNHNPLYKPWINRGHDDVWRKVSERFYNKAKNKFGKEVEERFKKLEQIKKEK